MQHRPDIDGLRALAVMPVILFHAGFETFRGGFVGVDIFFVISGFLITTLILSDLERGAFSLSHFYQRRVRRILPALFFVMAVSTPVAVVLMIPAQLRDFAESMLAVVFFVSNILFWRETDYFAPAAEEQPLLHTWSLSVEEQFYVLFPLALVYLWRYGRARTVLVFAVVAAVSLVASEILSRTAPVANFYLLPTRAWQLLAGALCAFVLQTGAAAQAGSRGGLAALAGLAMIVSAVVGFTADTPTPSLLALLPVAGTCLVLLFAHPSSLVARLLSVKLLVGIGLVSYSAYLWHQPLLAFVRIGSHEPPSQEVLVLTVAATMALAVLTWRYVETPFRRTMSPQTVLRSTTLAAAVLSVASLAAISTRGFNDLFLQFRLDPEQAAMFRLVQRQVDIPMNRTLVDDGACRFSARGVDETFKRRFEACARRHGPGIVVLGDSHAMNVYNILAKAELGPFIAGIARGGCRPHTPAPNCHYDAFDAWVRVEKGNIQRVIYHQSGAYYLRDLNGKVDSRKAFTAGADFLLAEENVIATAAYLDKLADVAPVVWLGPFVEARVRFEDLEYLETGLVMSDTSLSHFAKLDEHLKAVGAGQAGFRYVSLVDFLALDRGFLLVGECVTYRDSDHFSACGEDLLARLDWKGLLTRAALSER